MPGQCLGEAGEPLVCGLDPGQVAEERDAGVSLRSEVF
jgi:hypothetical protein